MLRSVAARLFLAAALAVPTVATTSAPATAQSARPEAYIVRPGDTLSSIARTFGIPLEELLRANPGITDRDLQVGREIRFSDGRPRPPAGGRPVPLPQPITAISVGGDTRPGGRAEIIVDGLKRGERIVVEVGPVRGRGGVEIDARANRNGVAVAPFDIPRRADPGERWSFEAFDRRDRSLGDGVFRIAEGRPGRPGRQPLRVTGVITNEGVECPALRAQNGDIYTLAGSTDGYRPGDIVTVTGRIAERSTCMQGTTITVDSIRAAR